MSTKPTNGTKSGSGSGSRKRGVRFAAAIDDGGGGGGDEEATHRQNDDAISGGSGSGSGRKKKRPRRERPNEDEMDDVDDWTPEDDDSGGGGAGGGGSDLPSERDLLKAKRERRLRREQLDDEGGQQGLEDEEEEEEEDADEEGATSTSLAAEGVPIEPFNMAQETSDGTGYFDGDTYVFRSRGEQEEPDAWLESLGEGSNDNNEQPASAAADDDDSDDEGGDDPLDSWTEEELYAKLLPLVSDTETVAQAVVRYGNILKRNNSKATTSATTASQKARQQQTTATGSSNSNSNKSTQLAQEALNEVTEAANSLLLKGQVDIYQKTRNDLLKLLPAAAAPADDTAVQWEYQGSQDGQIHGPYTTQEMQGWIRAGYFVGPSAVKVRTVEKEKAAASAKSIQDDLLSDLMDDEEEDKNDKEDAKPSSVRRGEWLMSDQVDFDEYS